jgi:hypothetical protein
MIEKETAMTGALRTEQPGLVSKEIGNYMEVAVQNL